MKKTSYLSRVAAQSQPMRLTAMAAALLGALSAPAFAVTVANTDVGGKVVISQVYGGGGNNGATYKNDFIELFNRSDVPVNISGWSVQYASTSGTSWQKTAIPANVTLQPGQYYLVQESAGTGGSVALPSPDAIGTLAMNGSTGKVALVNDGILLTGGAPTNASIVDVVGFGGANFFEGSGGTPALTNSTAALRAADGCTDTNSNSSDFTTGAPVPRNTSSPLHACSVPAAPPIVTTCPASLALSVGVGGSALLTATDVDGIVNNAVITSTGVAGISLNDFVAASGIGANASVTLNVSSGVAANSYPVTIRFDNDQAQQTSCTVNVTVAAPPAITHTIPQIQSSAKASPYVGTVQTTEGVVTAKVGSGFFIQDATGDGDPTTSDGVFVYTTTANTNTVNVGDLVRLTGTVSEYTPTDATRSYTELTSITTLVRMGKDRVITPTNIQLPHDDLGQVEGMLVRFTNALTVSQLEFLGDRGEATLSSGRLELPTNRYRPGTPEALAMAAANAKNQIILDDGIFVAPSVIPYLGADGSLRSGFTVSNLTGVVDFGAKGGGGAGFKLQPTVAPVFSADNPRAEAPALVAGNVKVASANVLNYFTTFTDGSDDLGNTGQGCTIGSTTNKGNCRGADNLNEFKRQTAKIVGELKAINADVFGLMEIQNKGEYTVTKLVDALNEAISPGTGLKTYAVVPKPASTGTDAIRVAMIYKPAALKLVGGALSDADSVNNRPPMAQTFLAPNGAKFSVVVNHLKSKGCGSITGADSDQGDGQSCYNATRIKQAQRLVNTFVPQVTAAAGDNRVLLIGDFNAYGFEDPIAAITASGFVNQLERFVRGSGALPYSYVYGGESGYLDHALASPALNAQVVDAAEWHNNADEPPVVDYNTDGKPQDKYTDAPYRASDHDPVVISLNLAAPYTDVSSSVRAVASGLVLNRSTGKWSGSLTLTNTSAVALQGPLQVELSGLVAGATLVNASGSHNGAPYITLNSNLAPGASVVVPTSFSKTGGGTVSYSAVKVYSGTF
ncbi:ExeM/NucH family extracellular endonuclease [Duganella fentianensis]|uniref:ExeM/NucH family extracellular endonuclease n=1 Tax=Duganella fentianensis TaxID=2692177 RepID=UPI0032B2CBDE